MVTGPNNPKEYTRLYRQAFSEFRTRALWNRRMLDAPTPEDALVIARALHIEGNRAARTLAEQIEQACRAAHSLTGLDMPTSGSARVLMRSN